MNGARLVLGIDGGGTSTLAYLATLEGEVIGRGMAGPSNAKAIGADAARQALAQAIGAAFDSAGLDRVPVRAGCLGLAGFGRAEDHRLLASWARELGWAEQLVPANDGDLVIAAGTPDGHGVGVIAGTGSIVVGRGQGGNTARAGGWGSLMGDEGSGYAVVLGALRLLARRADGREPLGAGQDPLAERFHEALGVRSTSEIVSIIYLPENDRAWIAGLAPLVVGAANDDPWLASRLLAPAGRDLADQVVAVCHALGWEGGPLPLALAGGFLLNARVVEATLIERLEALGYVPSTTRVEEPALGAVALARRWIADQGGGGRTA